MKLSTNEIVANSEMMKNYKTCREKAEGFGKIFILKNNQPDAVLFSVSEYERLSVFVEYLESLDENDIANFTMSLPKGGDRRVYAIDSLKSDIKDIKVIDMIM
jgi:PHD/YefM family antitoxin component YafN of YafNO toxin-antitoxin module